VIALAEVHPTPLFKRWQTWALIVWTGSMLVVSARVALLPASRTVYLAYVEAGRHWRTGDDLYLVNGGYRYSPPVTVLFAALSVLPDGLAGIVWRALGTGVFLMSLAWWARWGLPQALTPAQRGALFLLTAPLTLSSLNNGQANLLLVGLLVLAVTACARQRWNLAAVCLTLACLLKGYPVAIALLLLTVYPRQLSWRLPPALLAGLALPFLFQDGSYIISQYKAWLGNLQSDDRTQWVFENSYRDLWLLIRRWGVPLSHDGYVIVQVAAGAALAIVCLAARRAGWEPRRLLTTLLGLGACWMMLLGPATESSTYALLAPSMAWALVEGYSDSRFAWTRGPVTLSFVMLLTAFAAAWFPFAGRAHALGIHPLATLVLTGVFLVQTYVLFRRVRGGADAQALAPPAHAA